MDVKMRLAQEVIAGFHGADAARKAAENFQRVFRNRQAPEELVPIRIVKEGGSYFVHREKGTLSEKARLAVPSNGIEKWSRLLTALELTSSASEAERMMKQRGFEINEQVVIDPTARIDLNQTANLNLRLGKKKFARIVVE
jgi:tyrosyl-tRNA synthetase